MNARRAFLACALALVTSACTRVATTESAAPGSSAESAGPRHSWTQPGILRFASINDPDNLNPLLSSYQVSVDLSMFWAGYLFNYNDKNEFVPELATEMPSAENGGISKDGLTITYHLRQGVKWHDGAPFDAGDVVFTWHTILNPNNNVQTRAPYDLVTAIDTPDKYTAVVHLKHPYAPFVNTFFTMSGTPYPVLPAHALSKYSDINRIGYNSAPIGTGPFIVKEWHRGQTLRMLANPQYWRGAPKLKEVRYQVIPDENTLTTSIRAHDIDMWYNASSANYPTASNVPGTRAILTPFTQYSFIGFNTARPVTGDPAVRKAIALATDRQRIIKTITFGVGIPGEGDQPTFSWAHNAALPPIPFDLAKARATLDAAGWKPGSDGIRSKNGTRLHLQFVITNGSATGARTAVYLQSVLREVGIEIEIKPYAPALMFANYAEGGILNSGKFDLEISSWLNGVDPDDATQYASTQIPPNGQNIFRFRNRELDRQEQIALTQYDRATRKKAYDRIQEILIDQLPALTVYFNQRFDVVSIDLRNYKPAHTVTTFWNTWEYEI